MDSSIRRRLVVVLVMVLTGFAGVGIRLYDLMVVSADRYSNNSAMYQGRCFLPAQRGRILDRHLDPLATDRAAWSLYVTDRLENRQEFVQKVSKALNLNKKEQELLKKNLPQPGRSVKRVLRGISGEKYQTLVKVLKPFATRKGRSRSVWFLDAEFPRYYPEGELAANVIGYVGSDQKGLGGIEYKYEDRLEASGQWVVLEVDARRKFMPDSDYTKEANVRGADVVLTIDSRIQHLVEQELNAVVDRSQAKQAMAVVLNPKNGEVLAMAAVPSFDPNRFRDVGEFRRKGRPVTDMFEPGSVIKPFIVAGALECGAVTPDRVFFCERGHYPIRGRKGRILKILRDDVHRFGNLSVRDIIVRSSNIGICKIAQEMGPEALYDILTRFGFGSVSGVDLPAETPGILRPVRSWSGLSMYAIPFGQEMATNCLVIATAYATLANRGLRIQPHIVKGYRNPTNGLISHRDTAPPKRVIDAKVAEAVIDMLIGVTEDPEGTGYKYCRVPGFHVAGKTGTAQKAGLNGVYEKGKRIASWAGFFPAHDPKVVIYVMVDEPTIGKYGGEVAGKAFAHIAEGLVTYWGLLPEQVEARIATLSAEKKAPAGDETEPVKIAKAADQPLRFGVMPEIMGMSLREAYLTLVQTGLRANFSGEGWVVSQETPPGQTPVSLHAGRVVLRSGPENTEVSGVLASAPTGLKPTRDRHK